MDATSYLLGKKSGGGGPTPTGTINITENGTHDVTNYASANVNVPTGGSVESIEDVNNYLQQLYNFQDNIPNQYQTLYNVAKTLYTPNGTFTKYVIIKNLYGKYKINWVSNNNNVFNGVQYNGYYILIDALNLDATTHFLDHTTSTQRYYSKNNYDTLQDAITAIQSNETEYTYSASNGTNYQPYDANSIYYSNSYIYNKTNNEYMSVDKISSNETIEVIS